MWLFKKNDNCVFFSVKLKREVYQVTARNQVPDYCRSKVLKHTSETERSEVKKKKRKKEINSIPPSPHFLKKLPTLVWLSPNGPPIPRVRSAVLITPTAVSTVHPDTIFLHLVRTLSTQASRHCGLTI